MKPTKQDLLDHLNAWSEVYILDYTLEQLEHFKNIGHLEFEDCLDGISEGDINCMLSMYLSALTSEDIKWAQDNFMHNFEPQNMRSTYDIDDMIEVLKGDNQ